MAEILTVQVHAPAVCSLRDADLLDGVGLTAAVADQENQQGLTRLKKVDNNRSASTTTAAPGSNFVSSCTSTSSSAAAANFGHVPKRRPIDIEFNDLTYSVSEGRNKGSFTLSIYSVSNRSLMYSACLFLSHRIILSYYNYMIDGILGFMCRLQSNLADLMLAMKCITFI